MQFEQHKNRQRRYIRYAIELPAVLVVDPARQLSCVVLDFCSHGLFLRVGDRDVIVEKQSNVKVRFGIHSGLGVSHFELLAQVMHSSANGLGVLVDNMPLETFKVLKELASQGQDPGDMPNIPKGTQFRRFFKNALIDHLVPLISGFFDELTENLEETNEHTGVFANRSALDDLVTTFKLKQGPITSEFCHAVLAQVDFIAENPPKKEDLSSFDRSLSLVEKEDFEDWLRMSAIIRKLANRYEDDLNAVTRELSRIFGRSRVAVNNPVSPAALCDSFRELVLTFELDIGVNRALYSCFGKSLHRRLPNFYQQIAEILCKQVSVKRPQIGQDIRPYHSRRELGDLVNREELVRQVPVSEPEPLIADDFLLFEPTPQPPRRSLTEIAGKLLDLLNNAENDLPAFAEKATPDTAGRQPGCYRSEELVSAINQLQAQGKGAPIHEDLDRLHQRLEQVLERLSQQKKSVSRQDSHTLDVYGRFFEHLFRGSLISDALKPYIESMHLPLLSLPLQGEDFLFAEQHPAKEFLNHLAVLDKALKGKNAARKNRVIAFLDKIRDRIVQESASNPQVFQEVEKELAAFSQQITRSLEARINHLVEVHEGQQKLASARETVQQEIDRLVAGRAVSAVIPMLLEAGWKNLLVFAELNKEKERDIKARYLKVLEDLMFWLFEQDSVVRMEASSIQAAISFIDDRLGTIGTSTLERKKVIDELTELLLGVGAGKVRKSIKFVKMPQTVNEQAVTESAVSERWLAMVEQLKVGDWLMLRQESAEPELLKIFWIGKKPPVYALISLDSIRNVDLGKAELAELFSRGAAEIAENPESPLTERTTDSMLQDVHEKFVFNATHDPDTEMFTRDEFIKQLKNEIRALTNGQHVLCQVDILEFRMISTLCGFAGTTQLLKNTARRIAEHAPESGLCARLGDNTFAILFRNNSTDQAQLRAKALIDHLSSAHFEWEDKSFPVAVSVGLTALSEQSYDVYQLLQQADAASLSAERLGQNCAVLFAGDDENIQRLHKLLKWIGQIDNVMSKDRLFARCQMIAPLAAENEERPHYEILLGIKDEDGNIIAPDFFIPAVERSKRMPEIDKWVINTVFSWIDANRSSFDNLEGFSINLSGQSINSDEFLHFLKDRLARCEFPLHKLIFEITETVASTNVNFTKEFIRNIKEFGCKFSLDDFGSGYSSYAYLKNLNVDYLKIDGAFVKDIVNNKADYAIVKSMNEIAHSLGLKTVAEYIENAEIKVMIRDIGVDYGQGFFIQKPMPLADLVVQSTDKEVFMFEDNSFWDI